MLISRIAVMNYTLMDVKIDRFDSHLSYLPQVTNHSLWATVGVAGAAGN